MATHTKRKLSGTMLQTDWTPSVFETIGCVVNITPPGIEFEQVDAPICIDDTGAVDSAPGDEVIDVVAGQLIMDPSAMDGSTGADQQMYDQTVAGTDRTWRLLYPASGAGGTSGKTCDFEGWVRKFKPINVGKNDYLLYDLEIVRTSDMTWSDTTTTTT